MTLGTLVEVGVEVQLERENCRAGAGCPDVLVL